MALPASAGRVRSARSTATEADAFHKKYYVPANIVIAVVGDLKASEAMPILTRYFGPIPAGPTPEPMTTIEPPQFAERSVVVHEGNQPLYMEGYHRPDFRDPDDAVYDAITDILSNGRTGRLYQEAWCAISGSRRPCKAAAANFRRQVPRTCSPSTHFRCPATRNDEIAATPSTKRLDKLKNEDVTDEELTMHSKRGTAWTAVCAGSADNEGLANQLAQYQTLFGDWRQLFRELDQASTR